MARNRDEALTRNRILNLYFEVSSVSRLETEERRCCPPCATCRRIPDYILAFVETVRFVNWLTAASALRKSFQLTRQSCCGSVEPVGSIRRFKLKAKYEVRGCEYACFANCISRLPFATSTLRSALIPTNFITAVTFYDALSGTSAIKGYACYYCSNLKKTNVKFLSSQPCFHMRNISLSG